MRNGKVPPKDYDIRRTLHIWNVASGKEMRRIQTDTGPQSLSTLWDGITCAAYSPDGKTLAVATGGIAFHLIDLETGKETRRFFGRWGSSKTTLRFSSDGRSLVAFDSVQEPRYAAAGDVQGWDVKTGKRLDLAPGPSAQLLDVGFPGDGRILVLANLARSLIWWDASLGKNATPFHGPLTPTQAIVFPPDGKSILTAARDQDRVFRWDAKTGALLGDRELSGLHHGESRSFEFSPDARYAATQGFVGSEITSMRVWDLSGGQTILDIEGPRSLVSVAFSPDSKRLAAPGFQHTPLQQWDIETGQEMPRIAADSLAARADDARGGRIVFSPDGKLAAIQVSYFQNPGSRFVSELFLCDVANKKTLHRHKVPQRQLIRHRQRRGRLGLLPRWQAPGDFGKGRHHHPHERRNRKRNARLDTKSNGFRHIAFSPDGRFLVTATADYDDFSSVDAARGPGIIQIWELATDQLRDTFRGHIGPITRLAFSPHGESLASGSLDTTVLIWDFHGRGPSKLPALRAEEMPAAWNSLVAGDETVSLAVRRMIHAPAPTLAYFRQHLSPAKPSELTPELTAKLIADLNGANFARPRKGHAGASTPRPAPRMR